MDQTSVWKGNRNFIMKIIFVDKLLQSHDSLTPQLIDGKLYSWVVMCENLKVNETFLEWIERKNERIKIHPAYSDVEGLLIHNIMTNQINESSSALTVRYDYLRTKNKYHA
jgi:hypothetical protein